MKKDYLKPTMRVVKLQHRSQILANSRGVTGVSTNLSDDDDFEWGGGGNVDAR